MNITQENFEAIIETLCQNELLTKLETCEPAMRGVRKSWIERLPKETLFLLALWEDKKGELAKEYLKWIREHREGETKGTAA